MYIYAYLSTFFFSHESLHGTTVVEKRPQTKNFVGSNIEIAKITQITHESLKYSLNFWSIYYIYTALYFLIYKVPLAVVTTQ